MTYGFYFSLSLLLTLAVEIPVLFLILKYLLKIEIKVKEIIFWGAFASLFSLPYLWFVFPLFTASRYYILIGEILVVFIEAIILLKAFRINIKNAFALSFIANLASYLVGLLVLR